MAYKDNYIDYLQEDFYDDEIEKGSLFVSLINSTIAFMIAYLMVYLTFQFVTIGVASYFQIETDLFFYKVSFLALTSSPYWNFPSVKTIFSSGPFISLFMGIIYFVIYYFFVKNKPGLLKLVIVWAGIHSFNRFFGDFVAGVVALKFSDKFLGFIYAANWMYISENLKNILALVSLVILVIIGFFSTRYFLSTAFSRYFLFNRRMKFLFKFYNVFIPALIGTVLIMIIKLPLFSSKEMLDVFSYNLYEIIIYLTLLFTLIPVFNNYDANLDLAIKTVKENRNQKIEWRYFFFLLIFYSIFRIILDPSLNMGLHFSAMENGFDLDQYLLNWRKMY